MGTRSEGSQAPGAFIQPSDAALAVSTPAGVGREPLDESRKTGQSQVPEAIASDARVDAEKLVQANMGWLRGWLSGRIADPELVHDLCQESFLKALRSARHLKDPARFPGWLYRIAQNTLRDHLRRQARRRRWFLFKDDLNQIEAPPAVDRLVVEEESQRLLAAVRALPPRYREPLLLKHARELSYSEIADILGISENAVQVRIFRARQMLRRKKVAR